MPGGLGASPSRIDKIQLLQFSKANPGLAGAGRLFRDCQGNIVAVYLGKRTNDHAEMEALVMGIFEALKPGFKKIFIEGTPKRLYFISRAKLINLHGKCVVSPLGLGQLVFVLNYASLNKSGHVSVTRRPDQSLQQVIHIISIFIPVSLGS